MDILMVQLEKELRSQEINKEIIEFEAITGETLDWWLTEIEHRLEWINVSFADVEYVRKIFKVLLNSSDKESLVSYITSRDTDSYLADSKEGSLWIMWEK